MTNFVSTSAAKHLKKTSYPGNQFTPFFGKMFKLKVNYLSKKTRFK